jgi:hypothetical protein
MPAHAHGFDPLWLTLFGIWLVVMLVACFAFARAAAQAEAQADECPGREMPELHPDDDNATGWASAPPALPRDRYAADLARLGLEADRERSPARVPRPGEE